ncbi:bifunctional Actin-depolymerizing factor homology domain/ADF-Cofilin/ADF-H-Gelsolin-like domain superfamily [Babesia duncani]|uniref:Bifunctional Actin-depolymerizing factor homology domain/ADF-Cofilin/ADF-H-Gelsolin-like domain superfamily n=1 Tax=Babesia duncani TaxID=323732 RepID=A0AAD9PL38_9APIC|nr:bifunctional Actin-depolymerizing factor homology domain/ADF-Cofilin/ADF-H-Gelsolin-like domain superfamily [Babesia duncani]
MESGIKVDEEVITAFTQMKLKKHVKYLILTITNQAVTLLKSGSGDVEELYSELPANDCAFVAYDIGRYIVLFMYAAPGASTNSRTIYSTTKQTVEKSLEGCKVYKNLVEDKDEVYDAIK